MDAYRVSSYQLRDRTNLPRSTDVLRMVGVAFDDQPRLGIARLQGIETQGPRQEKGFFMGTMGQLWHHFRGHRQYIPGGLPNGHYC